MLVILLSFQLLRYLLTMVVCMCFFVVYGVCVDLSDLLYVVCFLMLLVVCVEDGVLLL